MAALPHLKAYQTISLPHPKCNHWASLAGGGYDGKDADADDDDAFLSIFFVDCVERGHFFFARFALTRPKIHDDWKITTANLPLKSGAREFDWVAGERAFMALAALGLVVEARTGNAVNRLAMRADDMQYVTHVRISLRDHL